MLFLTACLLPAEEDASWIRYPALSPDGTQVAFVWRGDIWLVGVEGGQARILVADSAHDTMPVWHPDGKHLAFASDRHGNLDVFCVTLPQGEVRRLTWHSRDEQPMVFSPDGKNVLISAARMPSPESRLFPASYYPQVWSVPMAGGRVEWIRSWPMLGAQVSADGNTWVYEDIKGGENTWRKHHTSSVTRDIRVWDRAGNLDRRLTAFEGEDRNPVLSSDGHRVYYLTESSGTFNVAVLDVTGKDSAPTLLTHFETHPVRFLSASRTGLLCMTHMGRLYTLKEGKEPVPVRVDLPRLGRGERARWEQQEDDVSDVAVSPDGKELICAANGDLFALSSRGGTSRRLTSHPGQDVQPTYDPKGRGVVYASERSGHWGLYRLEMEQDADPWFFMATSVREEPLLVDSREHTQPQYAPDGKRIAYVEDRRSIWVMDRSGGNRMQILGPRDLYAMSDGAQTFAWSPDGRWLVVECSPNMGNTDLLLISTDGRGTRWHLARTGFQDASPRWVDGGRQILWMSDRFGLRSYARSGRADWDVFASCLDPERWEQSFWTQEEYDLWKEMKERGSGGQAKAPSSEKKDGKGNKGDKTPKVVAPTPMVGEGLEDRSRRLTTRSGRVFDALLADEGETLYTLSRLDKAVDIWKTSIRKGETVRCLALGASGGRFFPGPEADQVFLLSDGALSLVNLKEGKRTPLPLKSEVQRQTQRAYEESFDHVWEATRAMFYRRDFHGVNWQAMKDVYRPRLNGVADDREFADLLSEMLGELNVSHCGARFRSQDRGGDQTASLGFIPDPAWKGKGVRVAEVLRNSPLDRAHPRVKAGMILMAVNGMDLGTDTDWVATLNHLEQQHCTLTFQDTDKAEKFMVRIRPEGLVQEQERLYERWVRRNEEEVRRISQGRLGYVHIPGMSDDAYRDVVLKALGPSQNCEGLVVDTRCNGGGDLVGDLTMFLTGKTFMTYDVEDRPLGVEPTYRWTRPSVALVNEANYSDGHCFACAYKDLGIGKLVGMPVPGTCSFAGWERLSGHQVVWGTVPVSARNNRGEWLENHQTEPDCVVPNQPGKVDMGQDEQLLQAVEELNRMLPARH